MEDASDKSLGERIKMVRGNTNQRDFAHAIGVASNTLGTYERDENSPKVETLERIAKVGKSPLYWLLTGHVVPSEDDQPALPNDPTQKEYRNQMAHGQDDIIVLPRLNVKLSAGGGSLLDEPNIAELVPLPKSWIRKLVPHTPTKQLALAQVEGDSMEPTITEGNDVLLDLGISEVSDNAIYALRYADMIVIKRLQRMKDGIRVISDNPSYGDEFIPAIETDQLQVIGRVKWALQQL